MCFLYLFAPEMVIIQLALTCLACSAGITEGSSMCGDDFVEVYSDPSQIGKRYCGFFLSFLFSYIYSM